MVYVCVCVCPNLIRLSLQIFTVAPVSPYVPHTALPGPLQRAANQQLAQGQAKSQFRCLRLGVSRVQGFMGTYHALQSLGELVGLKHIFALLVLGTVHHLWAIIDRLLYGR